MPARTARLLIAGCVLFGFAAGELYAVEYVVDIKPLLQARCYACHGGLKQEAGLRLDTVALMESGGDSGPVISRDDAMASLILARITAEDPADRMPPPHEGESFDADQIDRIRRWIASGAPGPEDEQPEADPGTHWAFQPIVRPPVPKLGSNWSDNPLDAFIQQEHLNRGLTPQPEASRLILLRRLYIDLIGLPPTLQQIAEFESDESPQAYQQTVARLLSDPRHGERWARHWMDIWRYSDWWGLGEQLRSSQKHIWHWRDWIIESLNNDTPYDEMLRLMLAADELHPGDLDKLRATGFLARNFTLFNRPQWMDETVEHVGKGLLGLTFNCARCHDHKYDPIEQTDYYRMRAFFEPYHVRMDMVPGESNLERDGVPRVFDALPDQPTYRYIRGDENNPDKTLVIRPGLPELLAFTQPNIQSIQLPLHAWQPARQPWVLKTHVDAAKRKLDAATTDVDVAQAEWISVQRRATAMQAAWSQQSEASVTTARIEAIRAQRHLAVIQAKAAVDRAEQELATAAKQPEAEKALQTAQDAFATATTAYEAEIDPDETFTPLIGAQWTPTRFVFSGKDDPTIDFLPTSTGRRTALATWITDHRNPLTARVAANHIWMRHMGAPLVTSVFDFGRNGKPPTHPELLDWLAAELMDNDWSMKHLHEIIVTSRAYRMQSTTSGAETNAAIDPDNQFWWRREPIRMESQVIRDSLLSLAGTLNVDIGGPSVPPSQQDQSTRRSLYFFHSNNDRNQFLTTFDEALVKDCYRREQSIVPQQALALANSSLSLSCAQKIADRLKVEADLPFIVDAFTVMLGIRPNEAEIAACQQALESWRGNPSRARSNLIWALINHNDFVVLR